ncbi:unnamed protein product [Gongylonema pulchrum]|uniref:Malic enzyme NAD-binding domain-containing protein n=1 Tax=Gongylonema pulchrum TaxID=637853 RepID=A0A3P7Q167_9BILA|nr:unnamed protein product [Gongylonema pulchrum]
MYFCQVTKFQVIKEVKPTVLIGTSTSGGSFNEDGRVLFASGSPFPNVEYNGKVYKPGQGNNSYVFPGIGLGAVIFKIRHIDEEMFLIAAKEVAKCVTKEDIYVKRLYPSMSRLREISVKIALAMGEYAYKMYQTTYDEMVGYTYDWPEHDMVQGYPVPNEPINVDD